MTRSVARVLAFLAGVILVLLTVVATQLHTLTAQGRQAAYETCMASAGYDRTTSTIEDAARAAERCNP